MILCVDIGNSNTVIGLCGDDGVVARWRFATRKHDTSWDVYVKLVTLLERERRRMEEIEGVVLSSVVPSLNREWRKLADGYEMDLLVIDSSVVSGLILEVDNPSEVGADRIVNSVAAFKEHKEGVLVVDSGTAITIDVVTPHGEYRGGAIMPGIYTSIEALETKTAKLPLVEFKRPSSAIGRNTREGILSGVFWGFAGMVDRVLREIRRELDFEPYVLITGGLGRHIASASEEIREYDPDLTLKGLMILYKLNR